MDTRTEEVMIKLIVDSIEYGNKPDRVLEILHNQFHNYTFTYDSFISRDNNSIKLYWQYQAKPTTLCDITIINKGDSDTVNQSKKSP